MSIPLDDLRAEIRRRRLTIREVARLCGVNPVHLGEVLAGRRRLMPALAKLISHETGIPIEIVRGRSDGAGSNGV